MKKIRFSKEKILEAIQAGKKQLETVNKDVEKAINYLKKEQNITRKRLQNYNIHLVPVVFIDDILVPLYYLVGALKKTIKIDDFVNAIENEDFSKHASLHFTGETLDFENFGITYKKDLESDKLNAMCVLSCLRAENDGMAIQYWENGELCTTYKRLEEMEEIAQPYFKKLEKGKSI